MKKKIKTDISGTEQKGRLGLNSLSVFKPQKQLWSLGKSLRILNNTSKPESVQNLWIQPYASPFLREEGCPPGGQLEGCWSDTQEMEVT